MGPTSQMLFAVYAVMFGIALLISLGIHFIQAYGLFRMAKSCGLERPWLAWIPVANNYTIGAVAKCNAVKQRKKPMAYDKILLGLSLASVVTMILMILILISMMTSMIAGLPEGYYSEEFIMNPSVGDATEEILMVSILGFVLVYLACLAVSITYTVFWYIALWQVFKLFDEKNAVVYLVLSLLVNIAVPIIFIILGNKQPDLTPTPAYGYGYDAYGRPMYGQPPYDTYGNQQNM